MLKFCFNDERNVQNGTFSHNGCFEKETMRDEYRKIYNYW